MRKQPLSIITSDQFLVLKPSIQLLFYCHWITKFASTMFLFGRELSFSCIVNAMISHSVVQNLFLLPFYTDVLRSSLQMSLTSSTEFYITKHGFLCENCLIRILFTKMVPEHRKATIDQKHLPKLPVVSKRIFFNFYF